VYSEAIGFQDKAAGKPMAKDAIFRIYSMTKPLTSVAAMMLVDEGRLQFTEPVSKYLAPLAKMEVLVKDREGKASREPAKHPITIHDLLRHTAGLAYGEFSAIPEIRAAYKEARLLLPGVNRLTPEQFTSGDSTGAARSPTRYDLGIQHGCRRVGPRYRGGYRSAPVLLPGGAAFSLWRSVHRV
jgi:CubicO group peptidase (beta-lactamase class C family)